MDIITVIGVSTGIIGVSSGIVTLIKAANDVQKWLTKRHEGALNRRQSAHSNSARVAFEIPSSPRVEPASHAVHARVVPGDSKEVPPADARGQGIRLWSHWIGPWLWATYHAYILFYGWWVVIDLEGYQVWQASAGYQVSARSLSAVAENLFVFTILGASLSYAFARRHRRNPTDLLPHGLRGWLYAIYIPIDFATALALILTRHRIIFRSLRIEVPELLILVPIVLVVGAGIGWLWARMEG